MPKRKKEFKKKTKPFFLQKERTKFWEKQGYSKIEAEKIAEYEKMIGRPLFLDEAKRAIEHEH